MGSETLPPKWRTRPWFTHPSIQLLSWSPAAVADEPRPGASTASTVALNIFVIRNPLVVNRSQQGLPGQLYRASTALAPITCYRTPERERPGSSSGSPRTTRIPAARRRCQQRPAPPDMHNTYRQSLPRLEHGAAAQISIAPNLGTAGPIALALPKHSSIEAHRPWPEKRQICHAFHAAG